MKLSHVREGVQGHVVAMSVACRLHWKCAENGGLSACLWRGVSSAAACMGAEHAYVVSQRGAFKMHIGAIDAPTANCWRWRCWGKCAHMLVEVRVAGDRRADGSVRGVRGSRMMTCGYK